MRASHIVAAAAAAAVVTAGSAMTAGNTVPNTIAGYGEGSITGATVTAVDYVADGTDSSKLSSVVFTTTTDVTGLTATMSLKNGVSQVGTSPYSCALGAWGGADMTITCATADLPAFAGFDTVGLTVAP